jgi:hypothetical protein
MIAANPVTAAEPPRVRSTEIEILAPGEIKAVLDFAELYGKQEILPTTPWRDQQKSPCSPDRATL